MYEESGLLRNVGSSEFKHVGSYPILFEINHQEQMIRSFTIDNHSDVSKCAFVLLRFLKNKKDALA